MPYERLRPSFVFDEERLKQLQQIAPEAFADGKINWEVLKESLGEHLEEETAEAEHFGLFWPGKRQARKVASMPSKGTLVPIKGEGVNEETTKNIFIEGENLEVLKLLQKSYAGRIKMIYIDPPYNTGNDFIYDDNFTEPLEEYLKYTEQMDAEGKSLTTNKRADGRFHSKWLNMMYPRLRLARNLLSEDGVIFISIDDNEGVHLKKICDEVFGEECCLGQVVRATGTTTGQDSGGFGKSFDYVITYSKNADYELSGIPLDEDDEKRFSEEDKKGKYSVLQLRKTGNADRREDRPSMYYPVIAPDGKKILPIGPGGYESRWRFGPEKYKEYLEQNLIVWKEVEKNGKKIYQPYVKFYLEGRTKRPSPLWDDIDGNKKATIELRDLLGEKVFDNPKPTQLIKRLINIAFGDQEDGIVLDFFSGSATTGHAVLDYNKEQNKRIKFILVQLPELIDADTTAFRSGYKTISEIGKERLRRVIKKHAKKDVEPGYFVLKLEKSNFRQWDNYGGSDLNQLKDLFVKQETPLIDDWKADNLLVEVMLQEGFPLDSGVVELKEHKKNKVTQVSSSFCQHKLLVSFDKKIAQDTIDNLKIKGEDIFVCLDSALTDEQKVTLSDKGFLKTI